MKDLTTKGLIRSAVFLGFLTASPAAFAQVEFEPGYFIDESDKKISCFIKNVDRKNNPTEFRYKLNAGDSIQIGQLASVKEFAIDGSSKFQRATVPIDRSSDNLASLSQERNPVFQEERLFLKVLIEGQASLFAFNEADISRFFYQLNGDEIRQLVYKKFRLEDKIAFNEYFRQQLYNDLNCWDNDPKSFQGIDYNRKDLEGFFVRFNEFKNVNYTKYTANKKRDLFDLSLKLGLNSSDLTVRNTQADFFDTDFGRSSSFRFAIETEFVLPYNKNKWSIVCEPAFNTLYSVDKQLERDNVAGGILNASISYRSFELPIGVRHSFYLKKQSKVFVTASYALNWAYNSTLEFTRDDGSELNTLEIRTRPNLAMAIGYQHQNRTGAELLYQVSRDILDDFTTWGSNFNALSLLVSYQIF
ncbi:MAG: tRNA modification GTPase [Bacteroidota bacterium]